MASQITEQLHYPYGLKMANISYKASTTMVNRYGFNGGNEYEDEGELNYSNTFYRKYDAQIGRFTGVDILAEKFAFINPYQFGYDNPVMFNDPMGDQNKSGNQKGADGNLHPKWYNDLKWGGTDGDFSTKYDNWSAGDIEAKNYSPFWKSLFATLGPNPFEGKGKVQLIKGGFLGHEEWQLTENNNGTPFIGFGEDINGTGVLNTSNINNEFKYVKVWVQGEKVGDDIGINWSFDLKKTNDFLGYAGQIEGIAGVSQIRMLEHRRALPMSMKIGTFSKFSSLYNKFGFVGKIGSYAGYAGAGVSTFIDYKSYKSGQLSGERFGYHVAGTTATLGSSIAVTSMYGGPWGAVAGTLVGGNFWATEVSYDACTKLLNQTSSYLNNISNSISNGWYPSFH